MQGDDYQLPIANYRLKGVIAEAKDRSFKLEGFAAMKPYSTKQHKQLNF